MMIKFDVTIKGERDQCFWTPCINRPRWSMVIRKSPRIALELCGLHLNSTANHLFEIGEQVTMERLR